MPAPFPGSPGHTGEALWRAMSFHHALRRNELEKTEVPNNHSNIRRLVTEVTWQLNATIVRHLTRKFLFSE